MQQHYQEVNGITLYYERWNHSHSTDTIILIHGFLASSFSFRKLIPKLAKDFNIISIDFPPFGKSGKSVSYRYSYENIAHTIIQFIDMLDLNNIYAVGHSMGGQIILQMMIQRQSLFKKAILLCSSGYLPRAKKSLITLSYLPFFHRIVKYQLGKSGVLGNLHQVVYDQKLIDEEMIQGYTEPFNKSEIFRALTRMIRHREDDLDSAALQQINTPCLLIWGEHDQIVRVNIGKRLANDIPNSQLIILKEAGHLIPEEKVDEISAAIKNFIKP